MPADHQRIGHPRPLCEAIAHLSGLAKECRKFRDESEHRDDVLMNYRNARDAVHGAKAAVTEAVRARPEHFPLALRAELDRSLHEWVTALDEYAFGWAIDRLRSSGANVQAIEAVEEHLLAAVVQTGDRLWHLADEVEATLATIRECERQPAEQNEVARQESGTLDRPILDLIDYDVLKRIAESGTPIQATHIMQKRDASDVRARCRKLETAGLIHRPNGKRSGYCLTDNGREYYQQRRPANSP